MWLRDKSVDGLVQDDIRKDVKVEYEANETADLFAASHLMDLSFHAKTTPKVQYKNRINLSLPCKNEDSSMNSRAPKTLRRQ